MKILIIGGGGREHALAWRLWNSPSVTELIAIPGNPGTESMATCLAPPGEVVDYAALAEHAGINLTIVGPEAPLVIGIVDAFRARGLSIIGPTQAAAQLEGSKIFAKQFLEKTGIPTARSIQVTSLDQGLEALQGFSLPVVIKADGLAAGKGVIIAETQEDAIAAVKKLGPRLVIEEFLEGEEVSFIGLSDGRNLAALPPTQDHKRAFDNDKGPNTGGMGAYCDTDILSSAQSGAIMDKIMLPALAQMAKDGTPYTGFLYAGVMLTDHGPKVLEFNVRLGDPETQAIVSSIDGDFAQFLSNPFDNPMQYTKPSVCVVLAAQGYPDQAQSGSVITGVADAEATGAQVFHAGTRQQADQLVTNGGRVLGVTASGKTLKAAVSGAYAAVEKIQFDGMHYRKDIANRARKRR